MIGQTHIGDCRALLKGFAGGGVSVQTVVTSPPYWGLRDYGVAGQLGLERTPEEYVAAMVDVFRAVRAVLAEDGTVWLNLGDSYATGAGGVGECPGGGKQGEDWKLRGAMTPPNRLRLPGLKPKDLVGIPWMVAFALRADGWYLRQEIIWHKPNPMPESVRDRCTKAHEQIFLLAKSERYFYDIEAVAEPIAQSTANDPRISDPAYQVGRPDRGFTGSADRGGGALKPRRSGNKERKPASARGVPVDTNGRSAGAVAGSVPWEGTTRNKRSVWTVTTKPYDGAHFATFPPDLIEPCILAGSRVGDVVLDPFMGSGTTAQVAEKLGRRWIGCELNPAYEPLQRDRTRQRGLALGAA